MLEKQLVRERASDLTLSFSSYKSLSREHHQLSTAMALASYRLLALLSIFQVLRTNETSVSLSNQWVMASNSVRSKKQDRLARRYCGYDLAHYFKIESNQHFICIYVGSGLCFLYDYKG